MQFKSMCNYNPNSVYVFRYVFISERNESENERITLKLSTNCLSWLIYGYRFGVECIEKGYFTSTFISARFLIILSKKKFLNISYSGSLRYIATYTYIFFIRLHICNHRLSKTQKIAYVLLMLDR